MKWKIIILILIITSIAIAFLYRKQNVVPTTYVSGAQGTITLGPQCPVVREGEEEKCKDKPYQTIIQVFAKENVSSPPTMTSSDANGYFKVALQPGSYILLLTGGATFPICAEQEVTVIAGQFQTVDLSCDTGVR